MEILLFSIGSNEIFGINVFKVREIVAMPEVTAIAGALPHVLGVTLSQLVPKILAGRAPADGPTSSCGSTLMSNTRFS